MKVALLDDERVFRESFRIALWHEASISVVAEASSARDLYPLLEAKQADLVIADLMLGDVDAALIALELAQRRLAPRDDVARAGKRPVTADGGPERVRGSEKKRVLAQKDC